MSQRVLLPLLRWHNKVVFDKRRRFHPLPKGGVGFIFCPEKINFDSGEFGSTGEVFLGGFPIVRDECVSLNLRHSSYVKVTNECEWLNDFSLRLENIVVFVYLPWLTTRNWCLYGIIRIDVRGSLNILVTFALAVLFSLLNIHQDFKVNSYII